MALRTMKLEADRFQVATILGRLVARPALHDDRFPVKPAEPGRCKVGRVIEAEGSPLRVITPQHGKLWVASERGYSRDKVAGRPLGGLQIGMTSRAGGIRNFCQLVRPPVFAMASYAVRDRFRDRVFLMH